MRVFFALWPEPPLQTLLHQRGALLHTQLGGKLTRLASIHLTLVFLGEVDAGELDVIKAVAADVRCEPFALEIATAGCWKHNRIAWLAPRATPDALMMLVADLESGLKRADIRFDVRPYVPHVTVLRKADCEPVDGAVEPIEWRVRDFVLVRSESDPDGSHYSVVGRWPFQQQT